MSIFESRWEGATRIRTAEVQRYSLLVPASGGGELRLGSAALDLTHGHAVAVISSGTAVEVRLRPHLHVLNIGIEPSEVQRHFGLLSGEGPPHPPRFTPRIDPRAGRFLSHLAWALHSEVEAADSDPGLVSSMREGLLSCLLRRQPHDLSALLSAPPRRLAPSSVLRAEEYLEAHLDAPVTVGEVAEEIGVSVRSLQQAFKSFRGVTPMAFLRERRLVRARQLLLTGGPTTTVAGAARSVAMPHLGRFAGEYRERYGENPSETLLRAGGAPAGSAGIAGAS